MRASAYQMERLTLKIKNKKKEQKTIIEIGIYQKW